MSYHLYRENKFPFPCSQYKKSQPTRPRPQPLPFGDLARKYEGAGAGAGAATVLSPYDPRAAPTAPTTRDPRLNKLVEKYRKTRPEPVKEIPQVRTSPVKDPRLSQPPRPRHPPPPLPASPPQPPAIRLDMSRQQICRDTLRQVDEEVKAIVTSTETTQELELVKDTSEEPAAMPRPGRSESSEARQEAGRRRETWAVVTPRPSQAAAPVPLPVTGISFDFLQDSAPKKKSSVRPYLSKREELESRERREDQKERRKNKLKKHRRRERDESPYLEKNKKKRKKHHKEEKRKRKREKEIASNSAVEQVAEQNNEEQLEAGDVSSNEEYIDRVKKQMSASKTPSPTNENQCPECDFVASSKWNLGKHREKHQGLTTCVPCDRVFSTVQSLKRHQQSIHKGSDEEETEEEVEEEEEEEEEDGVSSGNDETYDENQMDTESSDGHNSSEGDQEYKSNSCHKCDKSFSREDALKAHIKYVHENPWSQKCQYCGDRFTYPRNLRNHMTTKHGNDSNNYEDNSSEDEETIKEDCEVTEHACHLCKKIFTAKNNLKRHIKHIHENPQRFKCNICSKRFNWSHDLKNHMRITHDRSPPPPLQCQDCEASFRNNKILRRHIKSHHTRSNPPSLWKRDKNGRRIKPQDIKVGSRLSCEIK